MFGSVSAWFYKALAGINADCRYPGFERILFKPCFIEELDWVKPQQIRSGAKCFWSGKGRGTV